MIINTTTSVGFKIPEEYKQSCEFKERHPEYKQDATTEFIWYTLTEVCSVELQEGE